MRPNLECWSKSARSQSNLLSTTCLACAAGSRSNLIQTTIGDPYSQARRMPGEAADNLERRNSAGFSNVLRPQPSVFMCRMPNAVPPILGFRVGQCTGETGTATRSFRVSATTRRGDTSRPTSNATSSRLASPAFMVVPRHSGTFQPSCCRITAMRRRPLTAIYSRIGFASRCVAVHPPRSRRTYRRTVTTSSTRIQRNAEASLYARPPDFKHFRTTTYSKALVPSNTFKWATRSHLYSRTRLLVLFATS